MKTLIVSDELYEKLKEASDKLLIHPCSKIIASRYAKDFGEFLSTLKEADDPCRDCTKKEYRENTGYRR